MDDLFRSDFDYYSKKLTSHKTLGKIISVLTFGFVRNKKNIQFYSEKYRRSEADLHKYNELINKVEELDKLLEETIELEGVRVSKHTFADVDILHKADYGIDWDLLREQVLQRDSFECQENDGCCNGPLQAHHIVSLSKYGTNKLNNLITLCKYHHSLKHDHMRNTL